MMNPALWQLFLDAAEVGSLSKVAHARETTQPHISRQISALEAAFGAKLFQRTGRGVALTAQGERILPKVRTWLTHTQSLENEILSTAAHPIGLVRLGILPSVANPFASTLLAQLKQKHPLISLRVHEGQGAQLEHGLEAGTLDLAIFLRGGKPDPRSALSLSLVQSETFLVGRIGDTLTAKQSVKFSRLDGVPLVTFCRPSTWRDQLDHHARAAGITLNVALEADSLALQLAMVAEGGMYALLGRYAIAPALREKTIQVAQITEPAIRRQLSLVAARTGEHTPACRAVIEATQKLARSMFVD